MMPKQVSEWIQRILTIGTAFAGADVAKGLRGLLTAQAENFFRQAQNRSATLHGMPVQVMTEACARA
jgi:hypothetical protein